jgi:hypothetical protein
MLTPKARFEWDRVAPQLHALGLFLSEADGTYPIWNGQQISIPGQSLIDGVAANPNGAVKCGNMLAWAEQYIDPTAHIDKFFRDSKPVNPSEAIAAFGTPDFDIRGPASTVGTNRGTGATS